MITRLITNFTVFTEWMDCAMIKELDMGIFEISNERRAIYG